jgi:hypothetical protein
MKRLTSPATGDEFLIPDMNLNGLQPTQDHGTHAFTLLYADCLPVHGR